MKNIFEIHRKYQELIGKPNEYSVCEKSDLHLLNANFYRNQRKDAIDAFLKAYVAAWRILEPQLRNMRHHIHVAKYGGIVELKEPGYEKAYRDWRNRVDDAIRHYNHICELDQQIAAEYAAHEASIALRLKNELEFSEIINTPVVAARGSQLEITF